MSRGKPPGKLRAATLAAFALIALASCASKPKAVPPPAQALPGPPAAAPAAPAVPTAPEAPSPAPPAAAGTALPISATSTASAGTALKTADPASLARSREEREEIESSIVFGSPSSLAKARDLASKATAIKAEDASVLDSLAKGISALAYPEATDSSDAADGASSADAPGSAQGLLGALRQAAAGHSPEVPLDAAGSPLGELIPALVLLASDSSDNSRRAFDALERFAKFGVPSIMPSILRGVDAERRGDWQGALGLYRSALAIAPDAWTAALGSGRALLALHRSGDALAGALAPGAGTLRAVRLRQALRPGPLRERALR